MSNPLPPMFAEVRHTYGRAHQRLRQNFTGLRVADLIAERLGARARTANGRRARSSCPS